MGGSGIGEEQVGSHFEESDLGVFGGSSTGSCVVNVVFGDRWSTACCSSPVWGL